LGDRQEAQGIVAALLAAAFLGCAPVIGRFAYQNGVFPLGLAASRTALAALALWLVYALFMRQFLYIFPVGLAECALAGAVNGIGSLFYYAGLKALDNASLAQLLYTTYPLFVAILLRLDGHRLSRLTLVRLVVMLAAVYLITIKDPLTLLTPDQLHADPLGVVLLLASAVFFAFHVVFSQRALYDVPPPTVTLYSLSAMAVTVIAAWLAAGAAGLDYLVGPHWLDLPPMTGLLAIATLATVTALSRLMLFVGVKRLGGVQTTLLSVGELIVALLLAMVVLHEQLQGWQWAGAALLIFAQMLISRERLPRVAHRPAVKITPPLESIADQ
jgi:drug/metabolite transporter (DMT)-like permease